MKNEITQTQAIIAIVVTILILTFIRDVLHFPYVVGLGVGLGYFIGKSTERKS